MKEYEVSALITKEDRWYVARCAELNVTSQGESVEEAKANLKEAVELYIESFGTDMLPSASQEPFFTTIKVAA
ncbi:MAG: type II toxin-antitoxin system HicB family antitoxin [Armatimonadetes bacterium]|nr:type II toxin-antitoxin system HicB family antitoxin [Armatimonadota bacterium]